MRFFPSGLEFWTGSCYPVFMNKKTGVYKAIKKDGTVYYRSSITYKNKHISLGSFNDSESASAAYLEAAHLLSDLTETIDHYHIEKLSFEKAVTLLNFRDHSLYAATPIYLQKHFFRYYLSKYEFLTFDIDDLFYYSTHKIMKRGGHLFVSDYGMQVTIHSRYGIKNYAVLDRDYRFLNGDPTDLRYSNIEIINRYHGVSAYQTGLKTRYQAIIHINGNYIIGNYSSEEKAAIAYNKAVDILHAKGVKKNYPVNYIEGLAASAYAEIYSTVKISTNILNYGNDLKKPGNAQ